MISTSSKINLTKSFCCIYVALINCILMTQLDYPVNVEDTLTVYFCLLTQSLWKIDAKRQLNMGALGIGRRLKLIMDVADKVIHQAERHGADVAVVAVDRGGREVLVYRTDLCSYNAIEPARRKAVTSAAMGMPTSVITGMIMPDPIGQRALAASPDMLAVPGGFPIMQDNIVIGGIGLSGGHYTDDHMLLAKALVIAGEISPAMMAMHPPPMGGSSDMMPPSGMSPPPGMQPPPGFTPPPGMMPPPFPPVGDKK
jgi:glc operon protein GlcG